MENALYNWFTGLDVQSAITTCFVMGILFAVWVAVKFRAEKASREKIWEELKEVKKLVAEVQKSYHQVDKLTFGTAIIVQKATGVKLIKQSADGKGDHALNRDL